MAGGDCTVQLYWIPVAAGTSRLQRASLRAWERIEAARCRRAPCVLVHSALKLRNPDGAASTLEMTPAFNARRCEPLAAGPVGLSLLGKFKHFRYEVRHETVERLPDEEFVIGNPICLSTDGGAPDRLVLLAPTLPRYTWGRRAAGTAEMWTSDSVISWLLVRAGVDISKAGPPAGTRAPGWAAGAALRTRAGC